ncbi:hypothetical protein Nepgr_008192 [Nepenthes gracilis]|uniref:Uncharacterized protein n=1 Tax=Nepenthes gracilis TaxID=150966 RepID=A0AAD3S8A7_NEPGR|nr:hypothetical protein Nepgr_008192 [Nepenthes gracilis]
MVFPDVSPYENSRIPKSLGRCKLSSFVSDVVMFFGGALVALLLVWSLWSFANSNPSAAPNFSKATTPSYGATSLDNAASAGGFDLRHDQPELTFYDDPKMSYSVENPVKNWDEKRRRWLEHHRSFTNGASERVLLVTGSQPSPCRNPDGDHLLLRFFKNKVDYCRRHGYEIFYNNVLLNPKMFTFWAKYPVVRAAMVAHPEAEWIWWVDSDAAITDMDFKLPLKRYKDHNLVVHGWADMIYEKKSWTGLNAGVFLIRNCQWSMDFLDKWASMGPQSPDYDKWGEIQRSIFRDKLFPESDDQTALAYLILTEKERWADKIYTEGEYYFEGYWHEIVGTLDHINDRYVQIEKRARRLRRRHAEKVSESYSQMMEPYLKGAGNGRGSWRRPFITHFTGCQPCSGKYNQLYSGDSCSEGMQKALNFADNQVLRNFGYIHPDIRNSSIVTPLPFDFPS